MPMSRDSCTVPVQRPITATHTGAVETSSTLLLIEVNLRELIQVAK